MAIDYKLTTFDNPFSPFNNFEQWFMFDIEKGYYTCSRLARIAKIDPDFTQKEIDEATERAIDEIIRYDFTNTYRKVKESDYDNN